MKVVVIVCLFFCLFGCRSLSKTVDRSESHIRETIRTDSARTEIRDTTMEYELPIEKSRNETLSDSSYLETSFAWSIAVIRNGMLQHVIANKEKVWIRIPGMVVYQFHYIRDEISENLELTETKTIVREKYRFLNAFFYWSGLLAWFVVIAFVVFKIVKNKCKLPRTFQM